MAVQDLWRRRDGSPTARAGRGMRWRVIVSGYPASSHRTKAEADLVHAQRIAAGPPSPAATVTVDQLLDRWLAGKRGLSKRGFQACQTAANQVRSHWGHFLAVDVHRSDVAAWLAGLQSRDMSVPRDKVVMRSAAGSTKAKALQALSGAMLIAVETGAVESNPCFNISPGRQMRRPVDVLTIPEIAALADAEPHYRGLIWMLATCGLRIGEAAALNVGDVIVQRNRLLVRHSKTGLPREVPVPAATLAMLAVDRDPDEPLFTSVSGGRMSPGSWRKWAFGRAKIQIGRPDITPHMLRHTAASLAIRSGADVKAVQRMLGHATAAMTLDTYGHLWDQGLDDVAVKMDAIIDRTQIIPRYRD